MNISEVDLQVTILDICSGIKYDSEVVYGNVKEPDICHDRWISDKFVAERAIENKFT